MRRSFALALASLTLGIGSMLAFAQGCSTSSTNGVQDLCGWLSHNDVNCYRRFAAAVVDPQGKAETGPACGVAVTVEDGVEMFTKDGVMYMGDTGATAESNKPTKGAFAKRDKLDVCFITAKNAEGTGIGGKVTFDPPLDPNAFPPAAFAFKMVDGLGVECGTGSYGSAQTYSISINAGGQACPIGVDTGSGGAMTTTTSTTTATGFETDPIPCGTFSVTSQESSEIMDLTCPTTDATRPAEAHRFNPTQIGEECSELAPLLPKAELKWSAGVVGKVDANGDVTGGEPGYVKLRISFPPKGDFTKTDPTSATVVEYFDCAFPPPLPPCADGVKGDGETDVDCGGLICKLCAAQQTCITSSDCGVDKDLGQCKCEPDKGGVLRCCGSAAM